MKRIVAFAVAVALLSMGATALAGSASSLGDCRMRLRERHSDIRVRFVMHTRTSGSDWRLRVFDEGRRVFRKIFTTDAEGDFVSRILIRRRPGFRRYEGRATEIGTGVVCSIVLRT
jgi:hypothetical protein